MPRHQGIGRCILQALLEQERLLGFRRVILETTATWNKAIEFYLRYGFYITHHKAIVSVTSGYTITNALQRIAAGHPDR